jgi:hypothetical protein
LKCCGLLDRLKKLELGHPPPFTLPPKISGGGGVRASGESPGAEAIGNGDGAVGMLPSGEEFISWRLAAGKYGSGGDEQSAFPLAGDVELGRGLLLLLARGIPAPGKGAAPRAPGGR